MNLTTVMQRLRADRSDEAIKTLIAEIETYLEQADEPFVYPKFMLTVERPEHTDYCRGCYMGSSEADSAYFETEDEAALIEWWSGFAYFNLTHCSDYADYRFELRINGEFEWVEVGEGKRLLELAEAMAEVKIADEKRQKEEADRAAREAADRKQLERLIAQYGIPKGEQA